MIRRLVILLILPTFMFSTPVFAHKAVETKAAFIRGGELWIKQAGKEQQITHERFVLNPKWSYNGEYLAYTSGKNADILWIYSIKTNKSMQMYKGVTHFEWAPNRNLLAFQDRQILNITQVKTTLESNFENVSLGVGNFSWLPDGSGFLVSSSASLLPTGWSTVGLYLVPLDAHMDTNRIKPFFNLPPESNKFFAVGTSSFKWSEDGRWIGFVAVPTASISSDQNTLCLLSADGKTFKTLNTMLAYDEWFKWAPKQNSLGFIQGKNRLVDRNKQLMVTEAPAFTTSSLASIGYVDTDFTWINDRITIVSRAKENTETYNEAHKDYPALYQLQLHKNKQKQITQPPAKTGDYAPYYIGSNQQLTWIRADHKQAHVWMANPNGSNAKQIINHIDFPANYYGRLAWSSIIAWHEPQQLSTVTLHVNEPAYAKWGKLAMVQVQKKYQADIVDYKHLGRNKINNQVTEESFRFWLRKSNREFTVHVTIRFESASDKVQSIYIHEN